MPTECKEGVNRHFDSLFRRTGVKSPEGRQEPLPLCPMPSPSAGSVSLVTYRKKYLSHSGETQGHEEDL